MPSMLPGFTGVARENCRVPSWCPPCRPSIPLSLKGEFCQVFQEMHSRNRRRPVPGGTQLAWYKQGGRVNGQPDPSPSPPMNTPTTADTAIPRPSESISDSPAQLTESGMEKVLRRAELRIRDAGDCCRAAVRRNPGRSVLTAAAGGYFINRLPITSLLAAGVKLAGAFAPPALIALGICRVAGYCMGRDRELSRQIAPAPDNNAAGKLPSDT